MLRPSSFNHLGARSLSQYEIATEELEITRNERNFSTAFVKVVLRHRTEFHVANSFIQTLIVLVVAFATFFFDLSDFSDRIMVNAVLLLVMATINASIQNVSITYTRDIDSLKLIDRCSNLIKDTKIKSDRSRALWYHKCTFINVQFFPN